MINVLLIALFTKTALKSLPPGPPPSSAPGPADQLDSKQQTRRQGHGGPPPPVQCPGEKWLNTPTVMSSVMQSSGGHGDQCCHHQTRNPSTRPGCCARASCARCAAVPSLRASVLTVSRKNKSKNPVTSPASPAQPAQPSPAQPSPAVMCKLSLVAGD